jgi:hypothetical protein
MYVCMYFYMYVFMYVFIVCMYACICVCVCIYVCVCMYMFMYVYMYLCMYICKMKYLMMVHAPCDITLKCCVERHIFFMIRKAQQDVSEPTSICRFLFVGRFYLFSVETK